MKVSVGEYMFDKVKLLTLFALLNYQGLIVTEEQKSTFEKAPSYWQCISLKGNMGALIESKVLPRIVIGEQEFSSISQRLAAHNVPDLSVAVIRNGQIEWSKAWGTTGYDKQGVDCSSVFQAGSLAKPTTLFAALKLAQSGRIDINKNIQANLKKYTLPEGKQTKDNPVTLNNLLEHTAGLTPGGYLGYEQGATLPTELQILQGEAPSNSKQVAVEFTPGEAVRYSGGGYTLVQLALMDIFNLPFENIMDEWLIKPVGMKQAHFVTKPSAELDKLIARGHDQHGDMISGGWRLHPEQAAAGLWATPSDMATLLIEIYNSYSGKESVLPKALVRKFLDRTKQGHAYGFRVKKTENSHFITHYGGTLGYRVGMTLDLISGDGAVYMTSSENGIPVGMEFLGSVARAHNWPIFKEKHYEARKTIKDQLNTLKGIYHFKESDIQLRVSVEDNRLSIHFPNGQVYTMIAITEKHGSFIHQGSGVIAEFSFNNGQHEILMYGEIGVKSADQLQLPTN